MQKNMADIVREKCEAAFNPSHIEIIDNSALHAGHAGARPGGQSHFTLHMTSAKFDGLNRVQRQRAVYQVLAAELEHDIHALALVLKGDKD